MGFSSKLKAHKHLLTLETLKFISEFMEDGNAKGAALRIGIPETYASRYSQWLKKHSFVKQAMEADLDDRDRIKLRRALEEIDRQMQVCKDILNLEEVD
jgi:hypothetical protein